MEPRFSRATGSSVKSGTCVAWSVHAALYKGSAAQRGSSVIFVSSNPPNGHVRPRARITPHPLRSTSAYWRYFFFPQQALITGGFVFVFTCSRGTRSPAGAPSPPSAGRRHRHRRSPSSIATLTPPWWPRLCALPSAPPRGVAPNPGERPTASITKGK